MFVTPLLILATVLGQAYGSALPPVANTTAIEAGARNETVVVLDQSPELAALLKKIGKRKLLKDGRKVDDRTLVQIIRDNTKNARIAKPAPFRDDLSRGYPINDDCNAEFFYCAGTSLWLRSSLKSIKDVHVSINPTIQKSVRVEGSVALGLKITQTVAVATSSTKGWNVGGKVSVKAGDATMELSGGYAASTTETITKTQAHEENIQCPPRTECRIETRTFTATVFGRCQLLPTVDCTYGKTVMCENPNRWTKTCFIYKNFAKKCNRIAEEDCKFSFPVLDSNGELMQQIAAVTVAL
ncbi:hypothetical protein PRK78_004664 [Emydomyces testavorans]|uniref:Uncharacterized protein n=1 Tax=Emydomyces testavorans TaxID=2070801 RepID=A0AAF0DLX6_9EURO|nr:hypothetical protein PRK78_004664 [Emydomyces testavorans]